MKLDSSRFVFLFALFTALLAAVATNNAQTQSDTVLSLSSKEEDDKTTVVESATDDARKLYARMLENEFSADENTLPTVNPDEKCVDDDNLKYIYTNKKGVSKERKGGCKFVAKKRKRRCNKTINGVKIRERCPVTCGNRKLCRTPQMLGGFFDIFTPVRSSCKDFNDGSKPQSDAPTTWGGVSTAGEDLEDKFQSCWYTAKFEGEGEDKVQSIGQSCWANARFKAKRTNKWKICKPKGTGWLFANREQNEKIEECGSQCTKFSGFMNK